MNFWLIKFEEDLPIDEGDYPFRMSMLADSLRKNGHQVVRWASDFDHKLKRRRFDKRHTVALSSDYHLELLSSPFQYSGSHSLARILEIYALSLSLFREMMRASKQPDAVVVAMPAPITCFVTAVYCRIKRIPFFVDARDMWPDILFDEASGIKKLLVVPVYLLMLLELKLACRWAHGLIGITPPFRDFLLKHAGRNVSKNDGHFPLSFQQKYQQHDVTVETKYWKELGVAFEPAEKLVYFAGTMNRTVLVEAPKVSAAMRQLEERGVPLKLVMCGTGNSEVAIKLLFEGLNNVVFPGHISGDHLAYLKTQASIALLAIESRKDYLNSLSNKFFDYASGGLPIVTNLGGIPRQTLEENQAGFFYEGTTDLVDILTSLSTDDALLRQQSENTLLMFEKHFNSDTVYGNYSKHLEASLA